MEGFLDIVFVYLRSLAWDSNVGVPCIVWTFGLALVLNKHEPLFSKKNLLHESSLFDIKFFFISVVFFILASYFLVPYAGDYATPKGDIPFTLSWKIGLGIFVLVFSDFVSYWIHRWEHTNKFLWRMHKLHHSGRIMMIFTVARMHPFSPSVIITKTLLPIAITFLLVQFFSEVTYLEIGGMSATMFFARFILLSPINHSPVSISFGPFNRIFVCPAFHQIHHSRAPEHRDKNFGEVFSLWDIIFKTAVMPVPGQKLSYGLDNESGNPSLKDALLGR